jgi:hypothetical protein
MHLTEHLQRRRPGRSSHLEASFIAQRRGMAMLAAIFPLVFIVSSLLGRTPWQPSISAYYWTEDLERNFFIGALCAIGVFLLLYKGYTQLEDWVLNVAGISAVGVGFFAMTKGSDCGPGGFSWHSVFAIVFFACIAYVCIFMAQKSLENEPDAARKAMFLRAYRLCAAVMAISVIAALALKLLPTEQTKSLCARGWTFWCESLAVWAFAAFWYFKTRELEPLRKRIRAQVAQGAPDPQTAA